MKKLLSLAFIAFLLAAPAYAADGEKEPIKIGILTSGAASPEWSEDHIKGFELATQEINNKGGIDGRPVQLIIRETKADPATGVRVAQELIERDHVLLLAGEEYGNVTAAISNLAKQQRVPFVASGGTSADITGKDAHPYVFVMEPPSFLEGTVVARASRKLHVKRWATIAPDFNYGHSLVAAFKAEIQKEDPTVQFVKDIWFPSGKLDGAQVVQALKYSKADGVYFIIYGSDLTSYFRAAKSRGVFNDIKHVGGILGLSEEAALLGQEYPVGWLAGGFPAEQIKTDAYKMFDTAYQKKFHTPTRWLSIYGYISLNLIKEAIHIAGTDREKIAQALKQVSFDGPIGPIHFMKNGRSTQGYWVGTTGFADGKPALLDWDYYPGDQYAIDVGKTTE